MIASSQRDGVNRSVRQPGPVVAFECGLDETEIEPCVVSDDDCVADEFEQCWDDMFDTWRRIDHGLGDPGEHGDLRRDGAARIDEGLECAETFATAQLDRTDLGDAAVRRRATRGLEIDHAEGDITQRRAEIVE